MVCLSGPRRRVGPVIRVDLADPTTLSDEPIAQFQHHARRHSDEVALICYTEKSDPPMLLEAVRAALECDGTAVLDALLVRDGRAVPAGPSRPSTDRHQAPDPGCEVPTSDHPQAQAMAAASALHGRGILPSRQALRDSIAGPSGAAARRWSAALHAAASGLMATIGTGPIDHDKLLEMATAAVARGLAEDTGAPESHHRPAPPSASWCAMSRSATPSLPDRSRNRPHHGFRCCPRWPEQPRTRTRPRSVPCCRWPRTGAATERWLKWRWTRVLLSAEPTPPIGAPDDGCDGRGTAAGPTRGIGPDEFDQSR